MKTKLSFFLPGLKIKRWLILLIISALSLGFGVQIALGVNAEKLSARFLVFMKSFITIKPEVFLGIFFVLVGLTGLSLGTHKLLTSVRQLLKGKPTTRMSELFLQKRQTARGPKIVVIGGGTGLSVLLRGLKHYTHNLTAVVTVADDGGSSGILREEMGVLPPGDIRNCILAMAEAESSLQDLFNYRFTEGSLAGHNFGNLFLAAMTQVSGGSFEQAIKEMGRVLAVSGRVYPATLEKVTLNAETYSGDIIRGETNIGVNDRPIKRLFLEPSGAKALPEVLKALREADAVVLGPGSLYTSILPNLLIEDITKALKKTPALVLYVVNVMCQPGETIHFKASDHVKTLVEYLKPNTLDFVVLNKGEVPESWKHPYSLEGSEPVIFDGEEIISMGYNILANDYLKFDEFIRHDEEALAKDIIDLIFSKKYTVEERRQISAAFNNFAD